MTDVPDFLCQWLWFRAASLRCVSTGFHRRRRDPGHCGRASRTRQIRPSQIRPSHVKCILDTLTQEVPAADEVPSMEVL